jgi:MFS family permease
MTRYATRTPFFYGWVIVGFAIVTNMVAAGSIFWAVTIYVPAIARDFGVERTPVVMAFMAGQATYALLGPFVGSYIDRHGSRMVLRVGALIAPLAMLATTRASTPWELAIGWISVSAARTALMPIPYNWIVTRWFDGRPRQSALGVMTVGFGLGGAVMLPVLAAVADHAGWRGAMTFSAFALLATYGFSAYFVVANRPAELGLRPLGAVARDESLPPLVESGFTLRSAVAGVPFWLLAMGLMLFMLGQGAVSTLSLDFFDSRAVAGGATLLAASALIRAALRAPLGLSMGRVRRIYAIAALVALTQGAAVTVLLISTAPVGIVVWIVLWGTGGSFAPMLEPLVITNAFGVRFYGSISGAVELITFGGQIFGPIGGAALFDATGSYHLAFTLYAIGFGVSALLFATMGRVVGGARHRAAAQHAGMIAPARHAEREPAEVAR